MNNVIIGTAGHIDHGKTTLIKALSGIETDTTAEEKERGMSINLGFAYFDLPSGKRCGVVDVPGHEKFIKNMLAGVSGINLVLLLVDSREGIMPQTKEHMDILSLLGIENYIIVMTKKDLVEAEYRELVKEEIENYIKGSILESSPIIQVDSISKDGIAELLNTIDEKTQLIAKQKESKNARLNVDRAFQVKGFGTVVTGTLTEGTINIGDEIEVYPKNIITKVRNIQVHEQDVKTAYAGQRTAINLNNVKLDEVGRGSTLASPNSLTKTYMIDTELTLIKDSPYHLELWDRVRVYTGTSEVMARVVPLGVEKIAQNEKAFVQLRLEEEIAVKNYDKFIIRNYSPMVTIGGGVILDASPKKHSRFNEDILSKLQVKSQGSSKDLVANSLLTKIDYLVNIKELAQDFDNNLESVKQDLAELLAEKQVLKINEDYIHLKKYEDIKEKVINLVKDYHLKNKLKLGIPRVELLSKYKIAQKEMNNLIDLFIAENILKQEKIFISLKDFEIKYDKKELAEKSRIETELLKGKFTPPSIQDLTKGQKNLIALINSLVGNTIVKLDDNLIIHTTFYEKATHLVKEHFNHNEQMTLAEFRDKTGSSRKYSMAILEYMDKENITKRVENYRVKGKHI